MDKYRECIAVNDYIRAVNTNSSNTIFKDKYYRVLKREPDDGYICVKGENSLEVWTNPLWFDLEQLYRIKTIKELLK